MGVQLRRIGHMRMHMAQRLVQVTGNALQKQAR